MARQSHPELPAVYRAVITYRYPAVEPDGRWYPEGRDGYDAVSHMGPYMTRSPATAAINKAKSWAKGRGNYAKCVIADAYIERGSIAWEKEN